MWAELGHSFFLYVPAISNIATNGNGTGKKCFTRNRALWFKFSIQSSVLGGATTVAKVNLFSTWTQSTVSFYSVYFSTQTNIVYLGLVNMTMITGTRS